MAIQILNKLNIEKKCLLKMFTLEITLWLTVESKL